MARNRFAFCIVSLLTAAGCGTRSPAPLPAPPAVASETQSPAAETAPRPIAKIAIAPAVSTAPPAASPDAALRDLAARLVESDGVGWRMNEKVALELERLGPGATARLWPLLQDSQVEVRRGAAFALLGNFNPNQPEQAAAMATLLDDSDRTNRGIALSAVKQMLRVDQVAAVPRLAAMLDPQREDKPANRAALARMLASLKADAAPAADKLAAAATADPDATVRGACLVALVQVAPVERAVPLLAQGLSDQEASVRLVAAARLKQLGPSAAAAVKELSAALADSDMRVRENAAAALIGIGSPSVPVLADLLSQNGEARKLALACLAKIGPDAKAAVPAIQKCLTDGDAEVKTLAERALAGIMP